MPISLVENMDCMISMARYPDKYFELAIVDPPYGIGCDIVIETKAIKNTKYSKGKGIRRGYEKKWDIKPKRIFFDELFRVSKNQIIWGANYFIEYLKDTKCCIIWDKIQEFTGSDFELAWTSFDMPCKAFRMTRIQAYSAGDWRTASGSKIHPCQKPVALYKWLLKNYAKEGDKILDSHMGSQSSRIACYDGGFDFTGFELDPDYFRDGCKRFDNHIKQLTFAL